MRRIAGEVGFVNEDMIKKYMPAPSKDSLVCGALSCI
jgi:hypothetical protein